MYCLYIRVVDLGCFRIMHLFINPTKTSNSFDKVLPINSCTIYTLGLLFKGLFLALHLFGEFLFIIYGFIFVAYILGLTIWGAFAHYAFIYQCRDVGAV